jgi:hypothetical protein
MNPETLQAARSPADLQAESTFKDWIRRLVTGAAELQALDAGEIDAVMDPATGSAILLPEAQAVLRGSSRRASRDSGRTKARRIAAVARASASNRLLAALPAKEYERLLAFLEPVTLTYGEVLYEPGERMPYVYFPNDCVVSLLTVIEGHRALEVGMVGREGMVGARLGLGIDTSSVRALVQGTGTALRIKSARFLREFRRSPALQRAVFRFTDALMIQISMQPLPCGTGTAHTLAADDSRARTLRPIPSDAGISRGHARRAPSGCDVGCECTTTPETDPLSARHHRDPRSAGSRSRLLFLLSASPAPGAQHREVIVTHVRAAINDVLMSLFGSDDGANSERPREPYAPLGVCGHGIRILFQNRRPL